MRYRVDFMYGGWASFDQGEEARAREVYEQSGIRLRLCKDLGDDGEVIEGLPIGAELKKGSA